MNQPLSARRLRFGIILLILWWAPLWLLLPELAQQLGIQLTDASQSTMTLIIIIIQTIIGIIGLAIVGNDVGTIIKHSSYRKTPKIMWHILRTGQTEGVYKIPEDKL